MPTRSQRHAVWRTTPSASAASVTVSSFDRVATIVLPSEMSYKRKKAPVPSPALSRYWGRRLPEEIEPPFYTGLCLPAQRRIHDLQHPFRCPAEDSNLQGIAPSGF